MKIDTEFYRSHKKFLLFLVSQAVSQMGSAMTGLAVVIWAYGSTGQVMASSLLAVCNAAAGGLCASLWMSFSKQPKGKLRVMFAGSVMCLAGILLFGMGRSLLWWCIVVFIGCFGSPVYQTYQTVLLRERVPVSMQGRIFSLQGMITSGLTPVGCLLGAALADSVFGPYMREAGDAPELLSRLVGYGDGAGMGLLFVLAGSAGIVICILMGANPGIRKLEETDQEYSDL